MSVCITTAQALTKGRPKFWALAFFLQIHNITSYFINIDMCHVPRNAFVFPDPHQVCVRYMEDWPLALPPVETGMGKDGENVGVTRTPHGKNAWYAKNTEEPEKSTL